MCLNVWKLFQGFCQSLQIDGTKICLPAARIHPTCPQHHHPESTQLAQCHQHYLMLSSQGNRDHYVMNLEAYLCTSFRHMQLEHGTRFLFSVMSLQGPSFCHDKSPSNLSLTKYIIKRTGWASVSFPLVVLDERKQYLINSFGSYCVTYIRLKGLWLSTPKERKQ